MEKNSGNKKCSPFWEWAAWLPVFLFAIAIGFLYMLGVKPVTENKPLVALLNILFCAPVAFFVFYLAARSYLIRGERYLLFLGLAMLAWGLTTALIGLVSSNTNSQLEFHNIGVCLAAAFCLASAVSASRSVKSRESRLSGSDPELIISAVAITIFLIITAWAASHGLLPTFFIPGSGPTILRQLVLGAAVVQFFFAAVIFRLLYVKLKISFLHWYSLGMILLDVGLLGVWLTIPGTPLNWVARSAQFLAGPYILIAVICVRRDLSAWNISLEQALQKSEERYKQLFENMDEAFALHEIICNEKGEPEDYRFLDVNPAFEKLTGLNRARIIGRRVLEVMPQTEPSWVKAYGSVALTGKPTRFENFASALNRWYEVFAYRPSPNQFAVVFTDISERKQAEEELRKLNRTLKAHSDSSRAMVRADNEKEYLEEICKIIVEDCGHSMVWIGYAEPDEAKTVRPVAQAGFEEGYLKTVNISWADTERGRGPTGTAIRTGKPAICRNMQTDPDFKPWREEAVKRGYASSIVIPLKTAGRVFGAITIYSREPDPFSEKEVRLLSELADDLAYGITAIRMRAERAQAEEILRRDKDTFERIVKERTKELVESQVELEKSKRLSDIGVLAATVAHELRNPLALISVAAHNIKRKAKNPELEKHLEGIEKKVAESDQIINNLLFYTRLRAPHYESVDISAIIEECAEGLGERNKKEPRVSVDLEPIRGVLIEVDPTQIKEVFNNILHNASDAVFPDNGLIKIAAKNEDEFIEITVQDNGGGIDKDALAKVFDPFFTTKTKGTGLGLTVCRHIINFHKGDIDMKSEPGKGTTVSVRLPKKHG